MREMLFTKKGSKNWKNEKLLSKVIWSSDSAALMISDELGIHQMPRNSNNVEILGNIYENKDLFTMQIEREIKDYAGCIYWDSSSKGNYHGRHVRFNCYCADITINKKRYRKRSRNYNLLVEWLRAKTAEKQWLTGK